MMAPTASQTGDDSEIRSDRRPPSPPALAREGMRLAQEISQTLQTTLDLEHLLRLFADALGTSVPFDGMTYVGPEGVPELEFGTEAPHRCSYRLVVGEHTYGALTIHRDRPFTARDTVLLEYLLCSLLYPLRNALMYRDAVAMAHRDPLTGSYNRAALDEHLQREVNLAARHRQPLALIIFDLDHFKRINDAFGHAAGDCAIRAAADCARASVRSTDMLFRWGGEEFVILLRNTDAQGARMLAERIRAGLTHIPCDHNGQPIVLSASFGVTELRAEDTPDALFERADKAMYAAKQAGRDRVMLD